MGICRCKLLRFFNSALHALYSFCKHYLRAVGFKQISSFYAHCFGHCQNDLITSCGCDGCKTYSGISACWFNYDRIGLQYTLFLSVIYHSLCYSVFDAPGRIEIFKLSQNDSACFFAYRLQFKQRRPADKVCDLFICFHLSLLPKNDISKITASTSFYCHHDHFSFSLNYIFTYLIGRFSVYRLSHIISELSIKICFFSYRENL